MVDDALVATTAAELVAGAAVEVATAEVVATAEEVALAGAAVAAQAHTADAEPWTARPGKFRISTDF